MKLIIPLTLFLSGCMGLTDAMMGNLVKDLAMDPASACLRVSAILYGEVLACRTNEPGSVIVVKANGDLSILHGALKVPVDEKELKELIEQLQFHEEWFKEYVLSERGIPAEGM